METPLYAGEFADVWKGQYNGHEVAIKVLKVPAGDLEKASYPWSVVYITEDEHCLAGLRWDFNVEDPSSSERAAIVGCHGDRKSVRDGFGVDDERKYQRICEGSSRCRTARARMFLVWLAPWQ